MDVNIDKNECVVCFKGDTPILMRFFYAKSHQTIYREKDVLIRVRLCDKCYLKVGVNGTGMINADPMIITNDVKSVIKELRFSAKL